jgi:hypothetical protein
MTPTLRTETIALFFPEPTANPQRGDHLVGMLIEDVKAILVRLENSQSPHVENSFIRLIADFIRQRAGQRESGKESESLFAQFAEAAAALDPVVTGIMRLLAPPTSTARASGSVQIALSVWNATKPSRWSLTSKPRSGSRASEPESERTATPPRP